MSRPIRALARSWHATCVYRLGDLHHDGVGAWCLPDESISSVQRVFALLRVAPASCHSWIAALARRMAAQGVRVLECGVNFTSFRSHRVGATLSEAPIGGSCRALQDSPGTRRMVTQR